MCVGAQLCNKLNARPVQAEGSRWPFKCISWSNYETVFDKKLNDNDYKSEKGEIP